ncbi:beta-N-acetylglucosaminidase domain-containing protein [Kribbella sp. NPDC004138]
MPITDRAVLECFYGPLWSPADRAEVVRRAHRHGATAYVYGPSADERTGPDWRQPYGADGNHLDELVALTNDLGMTATWRVSPGAPLRRERAMQLSDADELAVLIDRLTEMVRRGFGRIIIAFDDLDAELDPATRSAYADDPHPMAAAQAGVVNAVHDRLAGLGAELLVCPTHYWGVESSRYRQRLGELLHSDLVACWTGSAVISPTITAAQVRAVAEQLQRPIWLWDNYPVNDWDSVDGVFANTMTPRRLPLAPLQGRDPGLADVLAGYGANAALQPLAGLPALCTALDWARDPHGYDADASFARALDETGQGKSLRVLAELAGPSILAERPGRVADGCRRVLAGPDPAALSALDETIAQAAIAAAALDGPIAAELRPWLDALRTVLPISAAAVRAIAAARAGEPVQNEDIAALRAGLRDWPRMSIAAGAPYALADHALALAGGGTPTF